MVCRGLPTYIFRLVWCVLYILMALAATLIYNQPEPITGTVKKQVPLFLFSLQVICCSHFVYFAFR